MKFSFENEHLFIEYAKKYGFNLFLGAGFSAYAYNEEGRLPLGNEIGEKLASLFSLDFSKYHNSLGYLCRKIKSTNQDVLNGYLRSAYKVAEFDDCYNVLPKLPIKNIVTLNIDDLIEKVYSQSSSIKDISDNKIWGNVEKKNTVPFYKLHGSITYPSDVELRFTEEEILSLFTTDNSLFRTVAFKLSCCPTIFWGSSFSDGNTAQIIQSAILQHKTNMPFWVVLYPEDNNYEFLSETFKDLGFNIISADTKELLTHLGKMQLVQHAEKKSNIYSNYRKMFPNNFVCNELRKSAISRPISDFFKGDEPQISDILSDNIVRTTYFNKVLNMVLANKPTTLITGIPGCGKSTLLLQLAFSDDISGRKFWFNNMIESEATRLCSLVKNDNNVTVFFDNLYNNLNAFKILRSNGIRVVTAERTINYEYVKSTLNIGRDNIIDISDLTKSDIQIICKAMNRSSDKALQLYESKSNVSLLEIAFLSFNSVSVRNKVKEYIKSVQDYNDTNLKISLIELFALVNYVSYCGVPISMDMFIFYFSNDSIIYSDIYYAIEKLNSIIIEDSIVSKKLDQDYMIMRSKVFAEIAINSIPAKVIKTVLNRFLESVSSSIIYRYDIFKKKAYDADITTILSLNDGVDFYEKLLNSNSSPYIKHQYALFLSRKNKYDEAWRIIDNAYTQCGGKILTIANTHAIILFNKNIDVKCEPQKEEELKQILKRSFETLEYCVTKDVRVNYHVLIYGRNTVCYLERFGMDAYAKEYIDVALKNICEIFSSEEFIYRKLADELRNIEKELIVWKSIKND